MNATAIAHLLGWILLGVAALQLLPLLLAALTSEPLEPLALSAGAAALSGASLVGSTRTSPRGRVRDLRARDGIVLVGAGWTLASLFGALPYFLSDALSLVDAVFESVAGFTTTSASVYPRLDGAPRSLLLWRALSQWSGGMAIVLFTIAFLPLLPVGGTQLFRAELPGAMGHRLAPRVAETARRLGLVYLGVTAAAVLAFWSVGDMPAFDALCHALSGAATGGFSTRERSLAAFGPEAQWVALALMLVASLNFVLLYRLLAQRRFRLLRSDGELRYFALTAAGAGVALWAILATRPGAEPGELRHALFQAVSFLTGTGFHTSDWSHWPALAQLLALQLLLLGGMAGSTSGGVKSLRVLVGLRAVRVAFARLLHPHAVSTVKYAGRPVSEQVLGGIWAFFTAYALLVVAVGGAVAAAGYDLPTAVSAGISALGNAGPGLGSVGAGASYGHFPPAVKGVLCFGMLAGRLEVFALLIVLSPRFWRRRRGAGRPG